MTTAKIGEIKNNLSKYLQKVKLGEHVLIYDRDQPVAILEPFRSTSKNLTAHLLALEKKGFLHTGSKSLPKDFFTAPLPVLKTNVSLVEELIQERREDR